MKNSMIIAMLAISTFLAVVQLSESQSNGQQPTQQQIQDKITLIDRMLIFMDQKSGTEKRRVDVLYRGNQRFKGSKQTAWYTSEQFKRMRERQLHAEGKNLRDSNVRARERNSLRKDVNELRHSLGRSFVTRDYIKQRRQYYVSLLQRNAPPPPKVKPQQKVQPQRKVQPQQKVQPSRQPISPRLAQAISYGKVRLVPIYKDKKKNDGKWYIHSVGGINVPSQDAGNERFKAFKDEFTRKDKALASVAESMWVTPQQLNELMETQRKGG